MTRTVQIRLQGIAALCVRRREKKRAYPEVRRDGKAPVTTSYFCSRGVSRQVILEGMKGNSIMVKLIVRVTIELNASQYPQIQS